MDALSWEDVEPEAVEGVPGVTIRWVIGEARGAQSFAMRVFEVEPGASIPLHHHWYEQEMFFLSGRGRALGVQGESDVGPGSVVWIPAEEEHGFINAGDEVLRFICCVPLRETA